MGLFGRADGLSAQLRRLETDRDLKPADVSALLEMVGTSPEFQLESCLWMFWHANARVREFAASACMARENSRLAEMLIDELPGKPGGIRQELAKVCATVGAERLHVQIGRLLHSSSLDNREAALDLIGGTGRWQYFLGHLKEALKDPILLIRQRATRILSRGLENPAIVFLLRELIHDDDATIRSIVIHAFAERPMADMLEPFFERLPLEAPQERAVMIRALSHLARNNQAQIEERLLPMLGDENQELREAAARLLGEMPDQTRALRTFLIHCRGLAFWLRERSIQSILKTVKGLVEPCMILMRDKEDDVRVGAMMMASATQDLRLMPLVVDIMNSDADWWIRGMAVEVLGTFASLEVTGLLVPKLADSDLTYSVIHTLGKLADPAAREALLQCLESPQRGLRLAALNALATSKTPEVMNAFTRLALEESDEAIRERATELLAAFGNLSGRALGGVAARRKEEEMARRAAEPPVTLEMANPTLNQGAPRPLVGCAAESGEGKRLTFARE